MAPFCALATCRSALVKVEEQYFHNLSALDGVRDTHRALLERMTAEIRRRKYSIRTGMRLMECVRLRVQDVDLHYHQIVVRDGKGKKDRVVPLPARLEKRLQEQLREVGALA